jgi:hypothetical protein
MVFPLSLATNASQFIAEADKFSFIRLFTVTQNDSHTEERDLLGGEWLVSNTSNVGAFSAVCYLSAKQVSRLHTSDRPLGLITVRHFALSPPWPVVDDWLVCRALLEGHTLSLGCQPRPWLGVLANTHHR